MSTNYRTIVFVGKMFESKNEAFDYLKEKNFFNEKTSSEIEVLKEKLEEDEISLSEMVSPTCQLRLEYVNYFTCEGFFIGYELSLYQMLENYDLFLVEKEKSFKRWYETFKENGNLQTLVQVS